jgi:hypothetical protein
MNLRQSAKMLFLAFGLLAIVLPMQVDAYLDPGSGSYFFQILLGLLLTVTMSLRIFWGRLLVFVKGVFSSKFQNGSDNP